MRADSRRDRERDRSGHRRARAPAADDPGAGVGGDAAVSAQTLHRPPPRSTRRWRRSPPARGRSPAAPTWWSARASGKAPLPERPGRDPPPVRAARDRARRTAGWCSARSSPTPRSSPRAPISRAFTALADASAIVGSPRDPHAGTIGGNVMNASPAMETGGPLICFGATVTLRSASAATRGVALDDLLTGPGQDESRARRAADVASTLPAPSREHGQLLRPARVPPPDGDRDRRRDRRGHARRRHGLARRGSRSPRWRPTIRRVPEAEAAP